MLTGAMMFEHELRKLLKEAVETKSDHLVKGGSASDFPTYRHEVGYIAGLRMALELADEANRICARHERGE